MSREEKKVIVDLITPMQENERIDWEGLEKLINFLIKQVKGILLLSPTAERANLGPSEIYEIMDKFIPIISQECLCAVHLTGQNLDNDCEIAYIAEKRGAQALDLGNPYCPGPGSIQFAEYIKTISQNFPGMRIIPKIVHTSSTSHLQPETVAELIRDEEGPNIKEVRMVDGNRIILEKLNRLYPKEKIEILSDDGYYVTQKFKLYDQKPEGIVSIIANFLPQKMETVASVRENTTVGKNLEGFLKIVSITTSESSEFGQFRNKYLNPGPIKTIMNTLGLPAGPCRPPAGTPTEKAFKRIIEEISVARKSDRYFFQELEDYFGIDSSQKQFEAIEKMKQKNNNQAKEL